MPDDTANSELETQAKLLTVAFELLRREIHESVSFLFANRDRGGSAPTWAKEALPEKPTREDQTSTFDRPTPVVIVGPNPVPVKVTNDDISDVNIVSPDPINVVLPDPTANWNNNQNPITAFDRPQAVVIVGPNPLNVKMAGGGTTHPNFSPVTAFDRPQAVVIVGPNPLPVKLDKAFREPLPPKDRGNSGPSISGTARAIAARFLAVLGPLYALSTILNQTNSGFGVFQKAVAVLGASLAPILLPVFTVLAAALLSLSDFIWSKILPALGDFYDWILKVLVPFAVKKGEDTQAAIEGGLTIKNLLTKNPLDAFADLKKEKPAPFADKMAGVARQLDPTGLVARQLDYFGKPSEVAKNIGLSDKSIGLTPQDSNKDDTPSFGQNFSKNMDKVIQSLAMSMGPKASYSSLGEVGKQAQLAALNADPIEMEAARLIIESIQEWKASWERYKNKMEPKEQINRRAGPNDLIGRGLNNRSG